MANVILHPSLVGYLSASTLTYLDYAVLGTALIASTKALGKGILWDKPDPYHSKWFERPQAQHGSVTIVEKQSRHIGQRLEDGNYDLVIFWGSQSGTAESFAHRLAKDLYQRLKMKALVLDLDDYDHDTTASVPSSKLAAFIVSTYGEGEPSDNAAGFLKWLHSASKKDLVNLNYAALGLGNSNYRLFNKAIQDVVLGLEATGATSLIPTIKADEATRTTEEDFIEWKRKFMNIIASRYALTECEPRYEPTLKVEEIPSTEDNSSQHITCKIPVKPNATVSSLIRVPVKARRNLITSEGETRQCVHLEIDISDHPEIKYKTGDHILIWPQNSPEEITRLLRMLGLEERKNFTVNIQPLEGDISNLKLPTRTTITELFQNHLEIGAPIKRETLLHLTQFATTEAKSWLQTLGESKEAFANLLANNHITLARILEQAKRHDPKLTWSAIPLSLIIESLPPMAPRYYSISSSSIISPRRVAITVSVKPSHVPLNLIVSIPGLTSTYLSTLPISPPPTPGATALTSSHNVDLPYQSANSSQSSIMIPIQIRRSTFKLPASPSTPIIMIGAGTGIAPFRAFIQQRTRQAATNTTSTRSGNGDDNGNGNADGSHHHHHQSKIGRMLLFFGCRHPDQDFLYRDELLECQRRCNKTLPCGLSTTDENTNGKVLDIITAFSRVSDSPENNNQKTYVQDRVGERVEEICRLMLEDDACLYICGAVQMAKAVGRVIQDRLQQIQGWDEERFALWRNERKRMRRWHEDVWG